MYKSGEGQLLYFPLGPKSKNVYHGITVNKLLHPFLLIFVFLSILHPDQSEASKILNRNPLTIKSNWVSGPVIERGAEVELSIEVILAEKHHAYVKQFRLTPENLDLQPRKLPCRQLLLFLINWLKKIN